MTSSESRNQKCVPTLESIVASEPGSLTVRTVDQYGCTIGDIQESDIFQAYVRCLARGEGQYFCTAPLGQPGDVYDAVCDHLAACVKEGESYWVVLAHDHYMTVLAVWDSVRDPQHATTLLYAGTVIDKACRVSYCRNPEER